MYYVYLLKLTNGAIYTGSTPDLKRRLKEHIDGKCKSTNRSGNIGLLWYCGFNTRLKARRLENYLKTGSGQAFRNRRLI